MDDKTFQEHFGGSPSRQASKDAGTASARPPAGAMQSQDASAPGFNYSAATPDEQAKYRAAARKARNG